MLLSSDLQQLHIINLIIYTSMSGFDYMILIQTLFQSFYIFKDIYKLIVLFSQFGTL